MTVQTSAGASLAVSVATPATEDQAGYEALSWTDVGEISDLGEFGPVYEVVTFNNIASRVTRKFKGTVNYGTQDVQLGADPTDAGQSILFEGADGTEIDTVHSFRVTLQDGTDYYFQSKIFSFATTVGAANNIVSASASLEIESQVIRVDV